MDTKSPTLSRPYRKRPFLPARERSPKQWGKKVTADDVDRLFDNLESSSDSFSGVMPQSPMPSTTIDANEEEEVAKEKPSPVQPKAPSKGDIQPLLDPKGEFLQPAKPVDGTNHNLGASCFFEGHSPITTSSPLDGKHVDQRVRGVSPIPFLWNNNDVDAPEEQPKIARPSTARSQLKGIVETQASPEQLLSLRLEPQLPSTAGSSRPAATTMPRGRRENKPSFMQRLREFGHSKSPRKSPFKEPARPEKLAPELEEEFFIVEDELPAWISIPRRQDPSTSKHNPAHGNAPQTNDNDEDKGGALPSSPIQGLKLDQSEKARTKGSGDRGENPSLEEGRTTNKKKKEEKSALPSPKKSAVKRTKTKGTKITAERVEPEPSPSGDLMDRTKDHKKKPAKTKVTKARRPSTSLPKPESIPHTSPGPALKPTAAGSTGKKQRRPTSTQKTSKSNREPQQEEEEEEEKKKEKKKKKAVRSVKRGQSQTKEQQHSLSPEADPFTMASQHPAVPEVTPQPAASAEEAGLSDAHLARGKRRRRSPGEWWLSVPSSLWEPLEPPTAKPLKQTPRPEVSPTSLERLTPPTSFTDGTFQPTPDSPHGDAAASMEAAPGPVKRGRTKKTSRPRKTPGERWKTSDQLPDADILLPPAPPTPTPPPTKRPKARKGGKPKGAAATPAEPPLAAQPPPVQWKMFSAPKTVKPSLAAFQDIFSRKTSPLPAAQKAAGGAPKGRMRSARRRLLAPHQEPDSGGEEDPGPAGDQEPGPVDLSGIVPPRLSLPLSPSMLNDFQSGPSSRVHLEQHEESDCPLFPLTQGQLSYWLSLGLYAPPLVRMALQREDEANLEEWLSVVWPVPSQAPPGQAGSRGFEWFCHQGQAVGLHMHLCSTSLCTGTVIMGSYMKKPLWVDHCAVTVFYMSTSSVTVTLNAVEERYSAGQSFMVPCGKAYSIENMGDVPAVLFFCRVAQSPE